MKEESAMTRNMVRFTVDLAINEGKFDQFESIAQAMIAGTLKEAGALGYDWFLSADRKRCRLIETYEDANAVLAHCTGPVVQQLVPKILETSSIAGFEVYGDPGPEAAKMLAGVGAEIFGFWRGLGL
jgi:quinol monooxygenase YgiN